MSAPKPVLRTVLGLRKAPFPEIAGITQIPVIRVDGTILRKAGYDEQTKLLYVPQPGLEIPPIPESPSQEDAARALVVIREPFAQFPFADGASAANARMRWPSSSHRSCSPLFRPIVRSPRSTLGNRRAARLSWSTPPRRSRRDVPRMKPASWVRTNSRRSWRSFCNAA